MSSVNNYYSMSKPITVNTDFDRPAMPPILKMIRNNNNNNNHTNSNNNNNNNPHNHSNQSNNILPIPHSVGHMHGLQQKKSRSYQTLLNNTNLLTAVSSNSATTTRLRPHFSLTDETTTSGNNLTSKRFQFQSRQQKLLKEQFDTVNQSNPTNHHNHISSASSEPSNLNTVTNNSTKHLNWIKSNVSPQLNNETDHLSQKLSLSSLANTFPGFYLNPNETNYTKLINSILNNKMKTNLSTSSLSTQTTNLPSSTSSSALSNLNYNSNNNKSPNMKSINEIDEMGSNSNFNLNNNHHNNNSTLPQYKFDTTSLLINSLNETLLTTSQSNLKNYDVSYRLNNLRKSSNNSSTTSNLTIVSSV
jgi:hypothetical protein